MTMSNLARVTYTNPPADLEPHHRMLDRELPAFRRTLGKTWPNHISGQADSDGSPYVACSPVDSEMVLGTFHEASPGAITRAVAAARKSSEHWGALAWRDRVAIVRRVGRKLDGKKYDLAMAVMCEVGKTRLEALAETEEAVALLDYYCDEMERRGGYLEPSNSAMPGENSQTLLRPVGVVGVICPFNYPVALTVNMMSAALVAGNSVIVKPSPAAGLTGCMLAEIFGAGDLPVGTFNLICGSDAGPRLVDAPGVDAFAFTGSHDAGMAIMRKMAAGPYMRPVMAEMGGKNPTYVAQSADPLVAAEGIAKSAFGFQGQKCTACSVAFVHESHYDVVLAELLRRAQALKPGDTIARDVTNGPLINAAAVARYLSACAHATKAGKLEHGGRQITAGTLARGNFVEPAIITGLSENDWLFSTELFAPVLAVAPFKTLEDVIARGNRVVFGLAAGFYGQDKRELDVFLARAAAGVLYANRKTGATTGAWPGIQSFCGWKGSGLTGKGGLGPHYLPQFMREQSRTIRAA